MGHTQRSDVGAKGPADDDLLALGKLHYLATYCPVHRAYPLAALTRLFVPAINHKCVRFFENEEGRTCAALIWARLAPDVSQRMVSGGAPPAPEEWGAGSGLWFLDLLAPFGHGRMVARHIARNPPPEPFCFARLGRDGQIRKVVRGDAGAPLGGRVQARQAPYANKGGR